MGNGIKYISLCTSSSSIKAQSDQRKFDTARLLKSFIKEIRDRYTRELKSTDIKVRQRATATYLIDKLALRVGNEKSEDEADTVGCCSLRCEHIQLKKLNSSSSSSLPFPSSLSSLSEHEASENQESCILVLDFLAKDSMRYFKEIEVDRRVWNNLQLFQKNKLPSYQLFDKISTNDINEYFQSMMEGLTAKVFRTYNATNTLSQELLKVEENSEKKNQFIKTSDSVKLSFFNEANKKVALLCNHQVGISDSNSKTIQTNIQTIRDQIEELKKEQMETNQHLHNLLSGNISQVYIIDEQKSKSPKEDSNYLPSFSSSSSSNHNQKDSNISKYSNDPLKLRQTIQKITLKIEKLEATKNQREDRLSGVSLTTSKINYIDPRVIISWCSRMCLPLENVYSKSMLLKFQWAMNVNQNFVW